MTPARNFRGLCLSYLQGCTAVFPLSSTPETEDADVSGLFRLSVGWPGDATKAAPFNLGVELN